MQRPSVTVRPRQHIGRSARPARHLPLLEELAGGVVGERLAARLEREVRWFHEGEDTPSLDTPDASVAEFRWRGSLVTLLERLAALGFGIETRLTGWGW